MRQPTPRRKPRKVQSVNFDAPIGGWIANRSLAIGRSDKLPSGATILDNWFPTSTGVVLRRGSQRRFGIDTDPVLSMFRYVSGAQDQLFASSCGPIHDITGSTPTVARSGGTNGNWHVQQITTQGGTFLIGVNGSDLAWMYDGTTWSAPAITFPTGTALTTAALSYVWLYGSRIWFLQKDSTNVWYLPVDSTGGELKKLPLGGMLTLGGALVWGQTWSLASGGSGGLSEQCVFCSTEGEVLAYQGQNPDSASGWSRVGLYRIGKPLGAKGVTRAGGDLMIATSVGLISLAKAANLDYAALGAAAASYPIEEAWTSALTQRGMNDWRCAVWPEGKMVIVAPPHDANNSPVTLVANSSTGAWGRFTGWAIRSVETFRGNLHFGDSEGGIWLGNVGGSDNGMPFTGVCVPLYEDLGSPAARKIARQGRVVKRSKYDATEKLTAMFNFSDLVPTLPNSNPAGGSGSIWGLGVWGTDVWGTELSNIITGRWTSLGGSGTDVSVCLQVTSGSVVPIDVELIRIDATFEFCDVVT